MYNVEKRKCVTYIRVSTISQGLSGLGLDAQREVCKQYIASIGGEHVNEFMDIDSGKNTARVGIKDAIEYCKQTGAKLVIAKLDRLARDVEFTFHVVNQNIDIYFCDMPEVNTITLGVLASFAQHEREQISQRTKAGLAAKKARVGYIQHPDDVQRRLKARAATMRKPENRAARKLRKDTIDYENKPTTRFIKDCIIHQIMMSGNMDLDFEILAINLNNLPEKDAYKRAEWNKYSAKQLYLKCRRYYYEKFQQLIEDFENKKLIAKLKQ